MSVSGWPSSWSSSNGLKMPSLLPLPKRLTLARSKNLQLQKADGRGFAGGLWLSPGSPCPEEGTRALGAGTPPASPAAGAEMGWGGLRCRWRVLQPPTSCSEGFIFPARTVSKLGNFWRMLGRGRWGGGGGRSRWGEVAVAWISWKVRLGEL